MKIILFVFMIFISFQSFAQTDLYKEQYRPRFHFSPAKNWCNDPNGLVYNNGVYHLFYQHNPFGNVWGHMTWAHATSKDLIHWKHQPIAIAEENGIMIFSGTCVIDKNNSTGFAKKKGQVPMVAIYTGHIENVNQSQNIAYSLDNGITWTKYEGNPILDLHKKDFRDPKVFWYEPKKYWVMALMFPNEHYVQFYSSKNLKKWNHLSDFGPAGDTNAVWECPDLTQVPVEGGGRKMKWLLQTSQNASMQYFVGEFDGVKFISENPPDKIVRPDYGPDYYAAICYNQLPTSHAPTAIGWLNNWNYANEIPTTPWKGAMSIPRNLGVKKINGEWELIQQPDKRIFSLRDKLIGSWGNIVLSGEKQLNTKTQQCEIILTIEPASNSIAGIKLAAGNNHPFEIGYDATKQLLYIDRSKTANQTENDNFKKLSHFETKLALHNNQLKLHIFFDNSIVEIFANDGEAVMTAQIFPGKMDNAIQLFSEGGKAKMNINAWSMKSGWQ
ncbi:MAG: glycoside hydrolase family 32 protein [Sphingobacteriales bacterium]